MTSPQVRKNAEGGQNAEKTGQRFDAVLFDYDGTLVDSYAAVIASFQYTFRILTGAEGDENAILHSYGERLEETFARFYPDVPYEEALAVYRSCPLTPDLDPTRPYPGMAEALRSLHDAGVRTAIITSRHRTTARFILNEQNESAAVDITPFLDAVVTGSDTGRPKPAPDPILKGLEMLSVPAESALYVGDSLYDLQCAKNAGVPFALVAWSVPYRAGLFPPSARPDALLERASDILSLAGVHPVPFAE